MISIIFAASLSFFCCKIFTPLFLKMLKENGATRSNFQKEIIPVAGGLIFPPVILVTFSIVNLYERVNFINSLLLALTTMALIGLIDDLLGNNDQKGIIGHFKELFISGNLSTGALKAIWTGFLGIYLVGIMNTPLTIKIIDFLIFVLYTNSINLLDLRPGRAIKGALLIAFFLILISNKSWLYIVPFTTMLFAYAPWDLQAKAMMGDTGSNLIGVYLGYISINFLPFSLRLVLLVILVSLHVYTEKYSLTKQIEKNSFLKLLDQWGRS